MSCGEVSFFMVQHMECKRLVDRDYMFVYRLSDFVGTVEQEASLVFGRALLKLEFQTMAVGWRSSRKAMCPVQFRR